jgi:hypothetical protein
VKAENKFFMAAVDIRTAQDKVIKAMEHLEMDSGLSAITLMRLAIQHIADAMEKTAKALR